jgi:cold shock CspA family protein
MSTKFTGTITFVSGKGWFFAENDADHGAIFIHQKSVEKQRYLKVDDRVEFELADNPRRPGEICGVNVRYVGHTIARQVSDPAVRP